MKTVRMFIAAAIFMGATPAAQAEEIQCVTVSSETRVPGKKPVRDASARLTRRYLLDSPYDISTTWKIRFEVGVDEAWATSIWIGVHPDFSEAESAKFEGDACTPEGGVGWCRRFFWHLRKGPKPWIFSGTVTSEGELPGSVAVDAVKCGKRSRN